VFLEGIYARLTAAGLTVYPGLAPKESALPFVVYSQVGASNVSSLDGTNALQGARIRFSCYGASYATSKELAAAVKTSLQGLLVTLSEGTKVQGSWLEYEGDEVDSDLQGTVYASHVDFSFMFA
jgi:hypothetical protein